jgi:putative spermidine/putrescine transport system substrate-binding protein
MLGACSSGGQTNVSARPTPPTANLKPQASIGAGEGRVDLLTWEGYADDSWVKPFTQQSGCEVHTRYVASTAEMSSLMADGGAGQWDLVSAPGDISLELVYAGDVKPMNVALIPSWSDFGPLFQSPAYNTVDGVHYGISLQWSPRVLLYNTKKFTSAPSSWAPVYDPVYKGQVTAPDNPILLADAAVYLAASQPNLAIKDPFELNRKQFNAAVALLTQQRPLIKRYWPIASDEIAMFQDGEVVVGSGDPYLAVQLQSVGIPVAESAPAEGVTGWADSWMLAGRAPHPNCAYLWAAYTATPKVQAAQALWFGETPVNAKACAEMDAVIKGSCAKYHADATPSYLGAVRFWKTPLTYCGTGGPCVGYDEWISAWNAIR